MSSPAIVDLANDAYAMGLSRSEAWEYALAQATRLNSTREAVRLAALVFDGGAR